MDSTNVFCYNVKSALAGSSHTLVERNFFSSTQEAEIGRISLRAAQAKSEAHNS
jgi:hypothetical protein